MTTMHHRTVRPDMPTEGIQAVFLESVIADEQTGSALWPTSRPRHRTAPRCG